MGTSGGTDFARSLKVSCSRYTASDSQLCNSPSSQSRPFRLLPKPQPLQPAIQPLQTAAIHMSGITRIQLQASPAYSFRHHPHTASGIIRIPQARCGHHPHTDDRKHSSVPLHLPLAVQCATYSKPERVDHLNSALRNPKAVQCATPPRPMSRSRKARPGHRFKATLHLSSESRRDTIPRHEPRVCTISGPAPATAYRDIQHCVSRDPATACRDVQHCSSAGPSALEEYPSRATDR